MKENEHSQNKNHRRAALDRMVEIADESGMYDLPLPANKEHPMKNWKQIKQTTKQTRTEKDQKIVADELTDQRQEARNTAYYAYEAACKEAAEIASITTEAAYATFNAEIARIEREYPQ